MTGASSAESPNSQRTSASGSIVQVVFHRAPLMTSVEPALHAATTTGAPALPRSLIMAGVGVAVGVAVAVAVAVAVLVAVAVAVVVAVAVAVALAVAHASMTPRFLM